METHRIGIGTTIAGTTTIALAWATIALADCSANEEAWQVAQPLLGLGMLAGLSAWALGVYDWFERRRLALDRGPAWAPIVLGAALTVAAPVAGLIGGAVIGIAKCGL